MKVVRCNWKECRHNHADTCQEDTITLELETNTNLLICRTFGDPEDPIDALMEEVRKVKGRW